MVGAITAGTVVIINGRPIGMSVLSEYAKGQWHNSAYFRRICYACTSYHLTSALALYTLCLEKKETKMFSVLSATKLG